MDLLERNYSKIPHTGIFHRLEEREVWRVEMDK